MQRSFFAPVLLAVVCVLVSAVPVAADDDVPLIADMDIAALLNQIRTIEVEPAALVALGDQNPAGRCRVFGEHQRSGVKLD